MTVSNAGSLQSGRMKSVRAGALGLAIGLVGTFSGAHAAQAPTHASMLPLLQATTAAAQPAGAVAVTDIDFRRGDGGSGKLVLRFDGDGAAPDLRTQGGNVVINLGGATLPASLQRPLNVTDFATPVQRIDARQGADGTQVVLTARGEFEPMAYQSGRDYIVEIIPRTGAAASDRAVGAASTAATMGQAASATVSDVRAYSGAPVTFNFQDVPVRTVLQLIADESNLNIVASDSVTGSVTLRLQNVPWDQALDIVLQAKSLDKRRSGNVVWVAPQSEIAAFEQAKEDARLAIEERAEMTTEYIPISYGNAEDIAKLLTEESKSGSGGGGAAGGASQQRGFLSSRGSLSFDRRTNTLLVIDIPNRVGEIKRLVNMLDKPVDQVIIEARIVIANESFARDLGARFGVSSVVDRPVDGRVDFGGAFGENGPGGFNVNLPAGVGGAPALGFTILGNAINWNVELSALQQDGRGEVISNPRVVTSNQREAVISQGQEVGYITVTGGQSNSVPTVEFKDVLLELKVTPTITNDGRVFLAMDIKKDEIERFVEYDGIGSVPLIAKRTVTTAVLIDDGQTVAIGGVYEFTDRSQVSKVPFLADIPVLGNLFKSRNREKGKAELLIFVTPKVMRVAQRPVN
ncbi:type IV pilus secretin PilQ [Luteimonas fraxinea]|uniref:Type IV pilus secretin PilQ n=1 Tax=Luteimonas fraxinea TaxID=2901869 RepID=A0ABS8UAR1_9GAMM|nr:type IV pilus secretin PilQ [Luteimonas fraxinea]MCD9095836.1 type IV pilus secretin PilQ [Luteimonas fraxinea]MCD9124425.1 type IV pilus secretin PilQ [Luteimonas fraxinea]UHH10985.1 type IV pilus secretin PilQ [Luteimonas fraxinea]